MHPNQSLVVMSSILAIAFSRKLQLYLPHSLLIYFWDHNLSIVETRIFRKQIDVGRRVPCTMHDLLVAPMIARLHISYYVAVDTYAYNHTRLKQNLYRESRVWNQRYLLHKFPRDCSFHNLTSRKASIPSDSFPLGGRQNCSCHVEIFRRRQS